MIAWVRQHGWRLIGLPLLLYTASAVFMTWPLATQLGTHLAGPGHADSVEYARLGWWGRYALTNGLNPFYQSLFAHPDGYLDAVQAAQPLIYWPISALGGVLGDVAGFNLWLLLEVILSGLTAYWLCRDVLRGANPMAGSSGSASRTLPALVGGLVFMSFPTVQGHLSAGHVNPLSNYALPIVALCLYRIATGRGTARLSLVGAAALWVMALGNFTFPVFTLMPLVLFGGLYLLIARRHELRWPVLLHLVLMFSGGALLSAPFYLPLARELLAADRAAFLQEGGWVAYSADLLAFVSPSPFASWLAPVVPTYARDVLGTNSAEGAAYLGIAASALAVLAVIRQREARRWALIALGCMLFSLGPILKVRDEPVRYALGSQAAGRVESYIVLPYAALQNLPILNVTRTPGRFNITTGLALGVLAALALTPPPSVAAASLSPLSPRRRRDQGLRLILAALLVAFILAEYQLFAPFPTTPAAVPGYFHALATRPDMAGRAVFDVPTHDLLAQKSALWQQTAHHLPLVAGYVSRRSLVNPAKLVLLSDLVTGTAGDMSEPSAEALRALLQDQGIGVVVYHRALLRERWEAVLGWATLLFGPPAHQDEGHVAFELARAAGAASSEPAASDPALPGATSAGWATFSPDFYPTNAPPGGGTRWLREQGALYLYAPGEIDQRVTLTLTPLLGSRRVMLVVDGQQERSWQVAPPTRTITFWVRLARGFHALRLVAPEGCTVLPIAPGCLREGAQVAYDQCRLPEANLCLSLGLDDLQVAPERVTPYTPLPVRLEHGLSLLGVRQPGEARPGQTIQIDTEWLAVEHLPGDYHLFVHVVDEAGTLVAQFDAVPGEGTFPTTQWAVPQRWAQSASIDLPAALPAGTYSIFIGWYKYPELVRLGVEGDRRGAASQLIFTGFLAIP